MNIALAEKEIFLALQKGKRVYKFKVDDTNIFIAATDTYGFVMPIVNLCVNIEKINDRNAIDMQSIVKPENRLFMTNEILQNKSLYSKKEFFRVLVNGDKETYVNEKFLKYFQNPHFYQKEKNGHIVVTENVSNKMKDVLVGIVMPMKSVEKGYMRGQE